jgi:hypothetical protein
MADLNVQTGDILNIAMICLAIWFCKRINRV